MLRDIEVTLEAHELVLASQVGAMRQAEAILAGLGDRHGFRGGTAEGWKVHIEGTAGEMAAAKALGLYWSGSVNTFKSGGDVGFLQVRTRSDRSWDLIVRDGDRDGDAFLLVVGTIPSFRVVGWTLGRDAKQARHRKEHGGRPAAYFVPQAELRPFDDPDFLAMVRGRVSASAAT